MNLVHFFNLFSGDLGIDLGTANTLIYARGRGIVLNEPSIVAINQRTGKVIAVGLEAREMIGRTPTKITAVEPLRDGVIADLNLCEKMLQHFIRKALSGRSRVSPRIVIGVPGDTNQIERQAVIDAAYRARASRVYLVREAMAAALGAGLQIEEPRANMVVDVGCGTTDIAVISLSGIVFSREVRVASNQLDEAIMDHLKREHDFLVGRLTAEQIKIELGSAAPPPEPLSMTVRGRSRLGGLPKTVTIDDGEVRRAISKVVDIIVGAVREALAYIPPELSADIIERGIVLTGGGALLRGLDQRLTEETGIPVVTDENPLSSVALGTGKLLGDAALLSRLTWENTLARAAH